MKRLLLILALGSPAYAGTITTNFNPLGSITFSSSTFVTGPIALDTATYSASDATNGSPCTWSMNIGNGISGTNRVIALACAGAGGVPVPLTTASFNGLTLNKSRIDQQGNNDTEIWYTTAPALGSHTVSATPSAGNCGAGIGNIDCVAISLVNVDNTSPVDVSTGAVLASGQIISSTGTLVGSTDFVFDIANLSTSGFSMSPNTGQTKLSVFSNTNQGYTFGASTKGPLSSSGSNFMTWTAASSGGALAETAVAFKKAP